MKGIIRVATFLVMARLAKSFHLLAGRTPSLSHPSQQQSRFTWRLLSSVSPDNDKSGKKRVVFLGTPEVAADSLKSLYEESLKEDCPYEIVSVITQPPKRRKRGKKVEQSPVGKLAEDLGISMLTPEKVRPGRCCSRIDLTTNV